MQKLSLDWGVEWTYEKDRIDAIPRMGTFRSFS
jgi:hypothetical protein